MIPFMGPSVELKKRSDIHWFRKIWHMGGVGFMAFIYSHVPVYVSLLVLGVVCAIGISLDILRQSNPRLNQILMARFGAIMRDHESNHLAGTSYLLIGVLVVALIFPPEIVMLTLLFVGLADPIASFVGIRMGKDKIFGHKSLQGSMAAFLVCVFVTYIYLYTHAILMDRIVVVSLLAGLIGSLAELIPIAKIDDNLSMPIVSSTGLWVLFYVMGHYSGAMGHG
jgi:diacylglycerol kinase (CTP)